MGRYTRWRNFKYLLYPLWLTRLVCRLHRELKFDFLVSQHAISAVAAGMIKQRTGLPVIMNFLDHLTGFMETWPTWRMPPPLLAILKRYELGIPNRFSADGVLTVSDLLAELFEKNGYPKHRMCTIHYGYDSALFRLNADALERRTKLPPTIVMHGSLDHHHLGRIALEAMQEVIASRRDVTFKFIGHFTPALKSFLNTANRVGLSAFVKPVGFIPYAQLAQELADATVGWIPYEESMGVHCAFVAKAVEYLGLGLPVASTALESIRRYFANEPMIRFSRFDGRDLGKCVLGWLAEPQDTIKALAPAAADRVRRELDWSVICRRAMDFVEKVIADVVCSHR